MSNNATATSDSIRTNLSLEQAIQCARIAEDNKAKDVVILDLRGITPIFDFFILMTGASRRQIHTLAEEIDAYLRSQDERRLSIQGYQASRWVVQDYGDVMLHVFDPDTRAYYTLEELWNDAKKVDWESEEEEVDVEEEELASVET